MTGWIDTVLILLVLTNMFLLGSSRLGASTRAVAFQGVLLGILVLISHPEVQTLHAWMLALGSTALKSIVFPWLLTHSMRKARVQREIEPLLGYIPSLLAGMLMLVLSFWIAARLPARGPTASTLLVPVAFFCMSAGIILIVGRRKALTQVLGYLVLENGVFVLGTGLFTTQPLLFEMGVLLDVFFAVLVFGIAIFHISREFNHIDTDQMVALKD